jgi:hypothetical protein
MYLALLLHLPTALEKTGLSLSIRSALYLGPNPKMRQKSFSRYKICLMIRVRPTLHTGGEPTYS